MRKILLSLSLLTYLTLATKIVSFDVNMTSLSSKQGFKITGANPGDQLGYGSNGLGDVNGDGIDDFIIGSWKASTGGYNFRGAAYVFFGRNTQGGAAFTDIDLHTTSLPTTQGFQIIGSDGNDQLGAAVNQAGDINGDGIGDIIVGAYRFDNPVSNVGAVYVIYGKKGSFSNIDLRTDTISPPQGFTIQGKNTLDLLGWSASHAGDINGDDIDDIIIGAIGSTTPPTQSYALVIFGSKNSILPDIDLSAGASLSNSQGFKIVSKGNGDQLGYSVNGAGDVNGDGINDIIIGAITADSVTGGNDDSGAVYIVFGSKTGLTDTVRAHIRVFRSCGKTCS